LGYHSHRFRFTVKLSPSNNHDRQQVSTGCVPYAVLAPQAFRLFPLDISAPLQ
jgi:hypothetical protein